MFLALGFWDVALFQLVKATFDRRILLIFSGINSGRIMANYL
jgi:hypothetical protein